MSQKNDKVREIIRELAAGFFSRESNRQSLITVTGVDLSPSGATAVILMTVLPESAEETAVQFAHRRLTDFKQYVQEHSRLARIPFFDVRIDRGDKNRRRLDEISKTM